MQAWLQKHELWDITMGAEHQPSRALIQANPDQAHLAAIAKMAKAIWNQLQTSFGMQNPDHLITDFKSAVTMMFPVDRPLTIIDQITIKFG